MVLIRKHTIIPAKDSSRRHFRDFVRPKKKTTTTHEYIRNVTHACGNEIRRKKNKPKHILNITQIIHTKLENYIFMQPVAWPMLNIVEEWNEERKKKHRNNNTEFLQLNANKRQTKKNLQKNVMAIKYEV